MNGNRSDVYVTIHYFDNGTGWLTLQYDSIANGAYKTAQFLNRQNSLTWKSFTWHLTDAKFANRQNLGADLRVAGSGTFYVDMAYVRDRHPEQPRAELCPRAASASGMDPLPVADLLNNTGSWSLSATKVSLVKSHETPWLGTSYSNATVTSWMRTLRGMQMRFGLEVPVYKPWGDHTNTFTSRRPMYDKIVSLGGRLDVLDMDEPFHSVRLGSGSNQLAYSETALWIQLVRQRYQDTTIRSVEPSPFFTLAELQGYLTAVNDQCAALGVEGLDGYAMDTNWILYDLPPPQQQGGWGDCVLMSDWCRTAGIPFTMIYWGSAHATNPNDAAWHTDVMLQGSNMQSKGLQPDTFLLESWLTVPSVTIPETQVDTYTRSALDLFFAIVP